MSPTKYEDEEEEKHASMDIENPLIHDAIHREYLEEAKGLPARHTNAVKKHEKVIKEKTFIHEHVPSNADE